MANRRLMGMALLTTLLALASPALAQTELKNDGFTSGSMAGFQAGFVAGEIGAARLVPPDGSPYQVTTIRFLFGGGTGTRTVTLHIWQDAGGSADPGTEIFSADYDVTASDEAFQEIDVSGDGIYVTGGFRVGIEFTHSGTPSIARDNDGMAFADRSFIFIDAGMWFQSSALGLTGDWIIRADVVPAGGAPDAGPPPVDAPPSTIDASPSAIDASPGAPDGGGGGECSVNSECPLGNYCDDSGFCTFDCRTNDDCPGSDVCNSLGQCIEGGGDEGGCGCRMGARNGGGAALLAGLLLALALAFRRGRR